MATSEVQNETVSQFVKHQINICGMTPAQIASELGYDGPNVISMFMEGRAHIPLDKIGPLAQALNINPALLLKKVMGEYMPETLAALQCVLEGLQLTQNELELITAYRSLTQGKDMSAVICDKTVVAVVMVD